MSRGRVLAVLFVALVPSFALTGYVVKQHHETERRLAQQWRDRGEADLARGRVAGAVEAFHNALAFARDDPALRLRLAQALVAGGRRDEARAYLLSLREFEPGNGTVNLELARLAGRDGNLADALRYYHAAIDGAWTDEPERRRRQARLELAELLLAHDARAEAQAELVVLAADLPPDASLLARVGTMLFKAGATESALEVFTRALGLDPREAQALIGTGRAAFEMGDYSRAARYLTKAARTSPGNRDVRALLTTVTAIRLMNPFLPRLSALERGRRALDAFEQAEARLADCAQAAGLDLAASPPAAPLAELDAEARALQPRLRQRTLAREPELLDQTMDLVFRIEEAAAAQCGPPTGPDLALTLIGRDRRKAES